MTLSTEINDAIELMFESGWTDGLPVVPPSEELVRRFVARAGRDGSELIAELPPLGGRATVERVAVNTVMAGCLPEHLPVVIAALQAMMDERFNLRGVMCSTGIHTPLLIVNGPVVQQLDINGGYNCFGAGWRANATIGRAVKLALVNLGGAIPGETNKATFGHPGAYTYCVAEDEAANPWMPMHVELGYAASDSTVTVFPRRGAAQRHVPRLQLPRLPDRAGRHHVPPGQRADVRYGRHDGRHRAGTRQVPARRRLEQARHPAVPL